MENDQDLSHSEHRKVSRGLYNRKFIAWVAAWVVPALVGIPRVCAQRTLSFANAVNYTVGSAPISVAVADFNADGRLDLVVANVNNNFVSVLFGNPNGTFQPAVSVPAGTGPYAVAAADLNGDGRTVRGAPRPAASG